MNKKRFYIISSTLLLIGLFAGVVQYVGMFDALYAAAVNPGHSWSQMECNTTLCVNTKVGIGTTNPQASLDVAGSYKIGSDYVYGTFTDPRDGNVYKTILIDGKTWMLEDMRYLPEVSPPSGTYYSTPKYNVFGYSGTSVSEAKAILKDYGVFYNIAAVKSTTNPVCPSGWHVSTDAEWYALESKFSPPSYCLANRTTWSCMGAGDGIRKLLKLNFPGWPNGDYFVYSGQWHYIWFLDVSGNAHIRAFVSTAANSYTNTNNSGRVELSQTGAFSYSVRCVKN